ncbi:MAG: hypothetical protein OCC45_06290 [Desulfotalea sp.]
MEKKSVVFNLILIVFTILFLNGCGSDSVEKDVTDYIKNQVPKFKTLSTELIDDIDSLTAENYIDDATTLKSMHNAVTKCVQITTIVEDQISPKAPEVRALHEIYIEFSNSQCNALQLMESGMENGDREIINKAGEQFIEAQSLETQWLSKLIELKNKHIVKAN